MQKKKKKENQVKSTNKNADVWYLEDEEVSLLPKVSRFSLFTTFSSSVNRTRKWKDI